MQGDGHFAAHVRQGGCPVDMMVAIAPLCSSLLLQGCHSAVVPVSVGGVAVVGTRHLPDREPGHQ